MFRRKCLTILLLVAFSTFAHAGDPSTDNPDQVFESVYARIGASQGLFCRNSKGVIHLEGKCLPRVDTLFFTLLQP